MFIFNIKLNLKLITKVVLIVICVLIIFLCIFSFYKVFSQTVKVNDKNKSPGVMTIEPNNYTDVLKSVHDNLGDHIGQKINFVGYVYRLSDFTKDEFVLARDMVVNANKDTVVVGFLCKYKDATKFKDGHFVEITGTIEKGDYHGVIPIINITKIQEVDKPADALVYPPDDSYIQTSIL